MIRAEGLDEAVRMLREIGDMRWAKTVLDKYGRQLVAKTKPYPSKPPGSKYIRTNNLSRQWYSQASQTQLEVGNRAAYSGWVQQRATQAWFHRQHGWPTVEDRFESQYMQTYFERTVAAEIQKILRKYA